MRLVERIFGPQKVPEHGTDKTGKLMVMVRDLYGLKSSGEYWRIIFAEILRNMYFFQC